MTKAVVWPKIVAKFLTCILQELVPFMAGVGDWHLQLGVAVQPCDAIVAHRDNARHFGLGLFRLEPDLLVFPVKGVFTAIGRSAKPLGLTGTNTAKQIQRE